MSTQLPNVLIVDDREANLVALEALLENTGCNLVRAANGNQALAQLLKQEFALVLLDVQMPEMDGYEVAAYTRENPVTREIPIIFVTATHATHENALRGYGTGAVDYLYKPINPHILRSKVRVFLELYQSKKRLTEEVEAHRATLATLRSTNEALMHFTHAASHDLRAPLRAVNGFLEALDEDVGSTLEPDAKEYLDLSRQAGHRMRALLDSLLAYTQLAKRPERTEVDCNTVLAQVRSDLGDRLRETGAALEVGALPTVLGDGIRIYELFLNLVSNALKFARPDESPRVKVRVDQRDGHDVFTVEDNGIGISAEDAKGLFQPFQRLHGQDAYEGTGLGLAICRKVVEQHGGKIWVEPTTSGARFCFTLGA